MLTVVDYSADTSVNSLLTVRHNCTQQWTETNCSETDKKKETVECLSASGAVSDSNQENIWGPLGQ